MRRSIISTRDLKPGDKLKRDDLDVKRPGTGIPPNKLNDLIGRTLVRNVGRDTLIKESDISELE